MPSYTSTLYKVLQLYEKEEVRLLVKNGGLEAKLLEATLAEDSEIAKLAIIAFARATLLEKIERMRLTWTGDALPVLELLDVDTLRALVKSESHVYQSRNVTQEVDHLLVDRGKQGHKKSASKSASWVGVGVGEKLGAFGFGSKSKRMGSAPDESDGDAPAGDGDTQEDDMAVPTTAGDEEGGETLARVLLDDEEAKTDGTMVDGEGPTLFEGLLAKLMGEEGPLGSKAMLALTKHKLMPALHDLGLKWADVRKLVELSVMRTSTASPRRGSVARARSLSFSKSKAVVQTVDRVTVDMEAWTALVESDDLGVYIETAMSTKNKELAFLAMIAHTKTKLGNMTTDIGLKWSEVSDLFAAVPMASPKKLVKSMRKADTKRREQHLKDESRRKELEEKAQQKREKDAAKEAKRREKEAMKQAKMVEKGALKEAKRQEREAAKQATKDARKTAKAAKKKAKAPKFDSETGEMILDEEDDDAKEEEDEEDEDEETEEKEEEPADAEEKEEDDEAEEEDEEDEKEEEDGVDWTEEKGIFVAWITALMHGADTDVSAKSTILLAKIQLKLEAIQLGLRWGDIQAIFNLLRVGKKTIGTRKLARAIDGDLETFLLMLIKEGENDDSQKQLVALSLIVLAKLKMKGRIHEVEDLKPDEASTCPKKWGHVFPLVESLAEAKDGKADIFKLVGPTEGMFVKADAKDLQQQFIAFLKAKLTAGTTEQRHEAKMLLARLFIEPRALLLSLEWDAIKITVAKTDLIEEFDNPSAYIPKMVKRLVLDWFYVSNLLRAASVSSILILTSICHLLRLASNHKNIDLASISERSGVLKLLKLALMKLEVSDS
jgi:hypothetical protein